MREKIDEKEGEIGGFREKVQELESVVAKNEADMEKWTREKLGLKESLRKSDEKAKLGTTEMDFTVHIRFLNLFSFSFYIDFFLFISFLNVWVIVTVGNFVTLRKEYL